MTSDRSPISELLAGLPISEEDLLALVEGEIESARAREIAAVLKSRPALARLVEGMCADREMLVGMGEVTAPEGMVAGAMEKIERDALLGAPAPIPFASIERKPSRRLTPALALAAGLALVLSAGAYFASMRSRAVPGPTPTPNGPIALEKSGGDKSELMQAKVAATIPAPTESVFEPMLPDATLVAFTSDGGEFVGPPTPPGVFESLLLPTTEIDVERAAVLAKEGRLALRMRACKGKTTNESKDGVTVVPVTEAGLAALRRKLADAGQQILFEELPYEFPLPPAPNQEFVSLSGDETEERTVAPVVVEQ